MSDKFTPPTKEQQDSAEEHMDARYKFESNALYDILKPFGKIDIPEDDRLVIETTAWRVAKLAGEEYAKNAEKVENSPGMKVLGALARLEQLDQYKEVLSVAAERLRDAAKVWAAELADAEKKALATGSPFDKVAFVREHVGPGRGQMNYATELFSMKLRPDQHLSEYENAAPDTQLLSLLAQALKAERYELWIEDIFTGGDLGEKREDISDTTHLKVFGGDYDNPSRVFLRLNPEDMVSLVEALKAE